MKDHSRDFGFVRRPIWLLGHVVVLAAVVVFIMMGFWQIRRLQERQDFNDLLSSRTTVAAAPLDSVLAEFAPSQEELELRFVIARGEYRPSEEIILLARSYNGLSGHHVLTPLDLGDGRAVVVDRGWVPIDLDQPSMAEFAPPPGPVDVYGVLRKTEERGSFGPSDALDGVLTQTIRVDLTRLDQQIEGELVPVYIQLQKENPASGLDHPSVVALPEPSEGPHRGYAVQWFLFAGVVAVGYPILLWRTAEGS